MVRGKRKGLETLSFDVSLEVDPFKLLEIGFLEVEGDGLISRISQGGASLLGLSSPLEAVKKRFLWEFFSGRESPEKKKEIFFSFLERLKSKGGILTESFCFLSDKGAEFCGILRGFFLSDGVKGRVLIALIKLPLEGEIIFSFIKGLPLAFFRINKDNEFEFVDDHGAREIFGCSPNEIVGRKVHDFHFNKALADALFREIMMALLERDQVRVGRVLLRRADGKPVWVISVVRGLYDERGNLIGREGVAIRADIIESFDGNLLVGSYDRFLGILGHDVRSLCGSALSFLVLLSETDLNYHQRKLLEKIYTSVHSVRRLFDNLMSSLSLRYGRIEVLQNIFDLSEVMNHLKTIVHPYIRSGVDFRIDFPKLPYLLIGDDIKLEQILINLLVNSANVTQEGFIELRVDDIVESEEKVEILFSVKDTGPGIPEEIRDKIFLPFRSFSSSYKGMGLGLYISKSLAGLMGGDLYLGESDRGTVFHLRLPFKKGNAKGELPFGWVDDER